MSSLDNSYELVKFFFLKNNIQKLRFSVLSLKHSIIAVGMVLPQLKVSEDMSSYIY